MKNKTYQILITLRSIQPKIWRRILVDPNTAMAEFHLILQTTIGWTNSHLHLFKIGRKEYAPQEFELERTFDYVDLKLCEFLFKEGQKMIYLYDIGDYWEHEIKLESIVDEGPSVLLPSCTGGKRCCPIEDSGGPHGYEELVKVIGDRKHPNYAESIEWAGNIFDPEFFDIDQINKMLQEEDFGCLDPDDI